MDIIDELLKYMKCKDKKILVKSNNDIDNADLNVVVIKILSWLKLEHKRQLWINEGKRTCFKDLEIDKKVPWCRNLIELLETESAFRNFFEISDEKFRFAEKISEEQKIVARQKAYLNYNPQKRE